MDDQPVDIPHPVVDSASSDSGGESYDSESESSDRERESSDSKVGSEVDRDT